jgi:hypothetical protein
LFDCFQIIKMQHVLQEIQWKQGYMGHLRKPS